jgi:hypothetical protein
MAAWQNEVNGVAAWWAPGEPSCRSVVIFDHISIHAEKHRPVSWIKAARKDFDDFPVVAQTEIGRALTILAEG